MYHVAVLFVRCSVQALNSKKGIERPKLVWMIPGAWVTSVPIVSSEIQGQVQGYGGKSLGGWPHNMLALDVFF